MKKFNFKLNSRLIRTLTLFIILSYSSSFVAQRNVRDSIIGTPWVAIHYGGNWSNADLAKRYGFFNHVGAMAGYKTSKNWVFGFDGNFMFGTKINVQGLFDSLTDNQGNITDNNGNIATIVLFSRGFNANVMVGKVFPILSPNNNSGIYVHAGIGYLQHKIRIESNDQVIPSLELDYKKGYDRYTTGVNFHQFVGYALLANQGVYNFYGGLYVQEGITYNRREIFFDRPLEPVSKSAMLDVQVGFKVGWFVPVYRRKPKEYYFD